jgi:hypothetical protein
MDTQTWATVTKYYQAVWDYFSTDKLKEVFDKDIISFHQGRNEKCVGSDAVIETYVTNFFKTCQLESTRLFNFTMQQGRHNLEMMVTYTIEQTHNDVRGHTFRYIVEYIELTEDKKFIKGLTLNPTLICKKS